MTGLLLRLEGLRRGPSAEAIEPAWLLVVDGLVVHAAAEPPPELPSVVRVGEGGWATEPIADAHVHLVLDGSVDERERERTRSLGTEESLARVLDLLEAYRLRGVAAVRDGGDPTGVTLRAAAAANARPDRYTAILPAGQPIRREGRYGAFLGGGVSDVAGAVRLLRDNRDQGATHAKVLATGLNSLDQPGNVGAAQFSPDELVRIAREAAALGLSVMVHANGPLAPVLRARPETIEHGFWLDPEDWEEMAAAGIGWTPTLGAWAELGRLPDLTPHQRAVVRQTDGRHRQEVFQGWEAGVPLLVGSDAGSPGVAHVTGLFGEMDRLREAGLPPAPAIAAATWNARALCARELGRPLGGLEEGGAAGFLWLDSDPVLDPSAWDRPAGVFLGGAWSAAYGVQRRLSEEPTERPSWVRETSCA